MSETNHEQAKKKSPVRNLIERRVPQILGIYLAMGWGVVQFVDWIASRYMLSPHLTDLSFALVMSLIPSAMIVAYYHGKPGKNRWRPVEKIGIPLNVLLTGLLIFFVFSGKDLGSISKTVTLQDESGKNIDRTIPKKDYIKRLSLFFLDNRSGEPELDWLQYGAIFMLEYDLSQDLFIDTVSPTARRGDMFDFYFFSQIREAGFSKGIKVPLLLKQKIAGEAHCDYFLSGDIDRQHNMVGFNIRLYETKKARLITEIRIQADNAFQLVDKLSLELKSGLGIPASHIEKVQDLPVAEIFTRSEPAARLYTRAINALIIEKDWALSIHLLQKALKQDPTFTFARWELAIIYLLSNQVERWKAAYAPEGALMKHLYKLPERQQYYAKIGYYASRQQLDNQFALLKMLIKMNPEDATAYGMLANLYRLNSEWEKTISALQKMLKIDPSNHSIYQSIGKTYQSAGQFAEAEAYLKKYAGYYPGKVESFTVLGDLYFQQGRFSEAKQQYSSALLIKPSDISLLLKAASIEMNLGDYDQTLRQYLKVLEMSQTPQALARVYDYLASFYRLRGQIKSALKYQQLKNQQTFKFAPPILALLSRISNLEDYVICGQTETALKMVRRLKKQLSPPYDQLTSMGYASIYLAQGDLTKLKEEIPRLEKLADVFKFNRMKALVFETKGEFYLKTKAYQKSIDFFEKELALAPSQNDLYRRLARAYRQLENYDRALEYQQKALKVAPFNPHNNYEMALLYLDLDKRKLALEHLNKALQVWRGADPGFRPALEARRIRDKYTKDEIP